MNPSIISGQFGLLCFALASLVYLWAFQWPAGKKRLEQTGLALITLASIACTGAYFLTSEDTSASSGLLLAASLGWLSIIITFKYNAKIIGSFTAPIATLAIMAQYFMVSSGVPKVASTYEVPPLLVQLHIFLAVTGESFAIIAFAAACLYLGQQKVLKKKIISQLSAERPALDKLANVFVLSIWSGFICLTFGLVSGALINQLYDPSVTQNFQTKIIWAVIVWVWYLATLIVRNVLNWPSKRIAQMCVAGFVLMAAMLFGLAPMGEI